MTRRHDEVKKAWETLFRKFSSTVEVEPYLPHPADHTITLKSTTTQLDARADLLVRDLLAPQGYVYADVAVVDTGTESLIGMDAMAALKERQTRKRNKYKERVEPEAVFVPLVCSVYGTLAPEAAKALTLAIRRMKGEDSELGHKFSMQRIYLQTAILKATSLCIRGRSTTVPPECRSFPEALDDCEVVVGDARLRDRTETLRSQDGH